jgi:hypothetical protein
MSKNKNKNEIMKERSLPYFTLGRLATIIPTGNETLSFSFPLKPISFK